MILGVFSVGVIGLTILVSFEACCLEGLHGGSIECWVTEDTPLPSHCGIGALLVLVYQLQSEFYLPLGLDLLICLSVHLVL